MDFKSESKSKSKCYHPNTTYKIYRIIWVNYLEGIFSWIGNLNHEAMQIRIYVKKYVRESKCIWWY